LKRAAIISASEAERGNSIAWQETGESWMPIRVCGQPADYCLRMALDGAHPIIARKLIG
jgi:hypothetical protein